MSWRRSGRASIRNGQVHGFGGFLRSLLDGLPWSDRAECEEILHLPAPPSRMFRVNNANGRTRIVGEDREDIEVCATKVARAECEDAARSLAENMRLLVGSSGDALELEIDVPRRWNRRGHVHLTIRVPRGTSAEVVASNGKIAIERLDGAVRARSSNGSVDIVGVTGDIDVNASNAKVMCSCTCGRLVARSSNGKIQVEEHRGSLDASTSNGLIRASLDEVGRDGVQLATSNGRVVLQLPEDVNADVDIRVDNGVIRNDRPLCKASSERAGRLRGRIGAGGAPIRVRTSNGSVSLH